MAQAPRQAPPHVPSFPFTGAAGQDIVHSMNDTLLFLGIMVAWFLVVRFVFPKLGIRGG